MNGNLTGRKSVVILGAGVVGLSTAVNVQKFFPDLEVTVIADKFEDETTSDGAAGLFRPTRKKTSGDADIIRNCCKESFAWYHTVWTSDEAPAAGIHRINGYILSQEPCHGQIPIECYSTRELTRKELGDCPGQPRYGYLCDTLMIECRRYLPWLMKRFRKNGGKVRGELLKGLHQIAGQYDVYVNCLGLGAREIFGDQEMYPVKGHLIRVHAPWIKPFYYYEGDTYIYPGQDNVVLGGTRERGQESTSGNEDEKFSDVYRRCCQLLPGLKNAMVVRKWIGVRPHRTSLRIETEQFPVGNHVLKVVHNIGHGGDGVALSWGTAVKAAKLVGTLLPPRVAESKL